MDPITTALLWDWLAFALRWLHVITGIAWIGSSFYFIALDLSLKRHGGLPAGVGGEAWQVHGGGFYNIRKYLVAPDALPEQLTWFKWESYSTWLSGFALLAVMYYAGAELYLIDPSVMDLTPAEAVGISLASLALGWLAYDALCRSPIGRDQTRLMLVLFGLLVAMAWGYTQVFSGRAALLHLGAFTATIMSANVFFIIIPNQKVVVADLKAGREPAPHLGAQAKQRSLHNNYLTLPVVFLMLSNHYPLAFASAWNWVIATLVFLMGVTIRHYFNTLHATGRGPLWTWGATAVIFALITALSFAPRPLKLEPEAQALEGATLRLASAAEFEEVHVTVLGRCAMCHAAEPFWDGIVRPPKGVVLETEDDVLRQARAIYLQAAHTNAMPPGNITYMEDWERALIARWYRDGVAGD
ncbi:MAG: urate hydroxylase PuuD [Pseudomonadota bacterium]